jgi:hypothetical protein
MSKSKMKIMSIRFFDIRGIIHFEFVPGGTAVNQTFNVELLKRLVDDFRRRRGELWRDCSLLLQHDNTPARSVAMFSRKRHLCHVSSAVLSRLGSI